MKKINWNVLGGWATVFAIIGLTIWWQSAPNGELKQNTAIQIPVLSFLEQQGEKIFNANCSVCHGVNAAGSDTGPPLIHQIYNPGHHSDDAFYRAVSLGVRQHHWPFGNMPPQRNLTDRDVSKIIAYIRALQIENGIQYQEHKM